jgi:hypothetical protein
VSHELAQKDAVEQHDCSVDLSVLMTKSRGMWQHSYPRKYGMEVTEQEGARVKAARCRFCKYYGR